MEENQSNTRTQGSENMIAQVAWRLVTAAVVLAITAFFTPGFSINSFWALALAAVVLYVTQFFVAGYSISWMAAIIGALIYGVVDYFLPGNSEM